MKKIILFLVLSLCVYIIHLLILDRSIKYLYIGNSEYNKYNLIIKEYYKTGEYIQYIKDSDYRIMDLYNEIVNNDKVDNREIQNILIKSNVIIISIGINDLEYKKELNYKYIDEFIVDLENLLKLMRKYNKDKIYFLGYHNKNEYYNYINKKTEEICKLNKIIFVDIEKSIYKQLY